MGSPNIEKTLTAKETFVFKDSIEPYFNPNWHFHPEFQISYILEGKGTRFVGDHVKPFEEDDLVLTGPNLPHLWRSDEAYFERNSTLSTRGLVLYFDQELLNEQLLKREEFYAVKKLVENSLRGLVFYGNTKATVKQMLLDIAPKRGFRRIVQLLDIIATLADSTEYDLLASPNYANVNKGRDVEKMHLIYDYVMANFRKQIELEEAARLLNMTTTSFCRYFRPRANKTFTRFVNEVRIGHARKLLLADNFNIAQIGYECGFNTLSNFNRQFRAIVKLSPQEYRKLFRNIKTNLS
ncbi:MAG: AraC family transcriptional regulator [Bacteroidota bacterium]